MSCADSRTETLIYVVFGDDFIAGLRADRRTWILLPARTVASVRFEFMPAGWLPSVRQTSDDARGYLQGLGDVEVKVWTNAMAEPLPSARATVQGSWLALSRNASGAPERLVAFDSVALIEVMDMAASVAELNSAASGGAF